MRSPQHRRLPFTFQPADNLGDIAAPARAQQALDGVAGHAGVDAVGETAQRRPSGPFEKMVQRTRRFERAPVAFLQPPAVTRLQARLYVTPAGLTTHGSPVSLIATRRTASAKASG